MIGEVSAFSLTKWRSRNATKHVWSNTCSSFEEQLDEIAAMTIPPRRVRNKLPQGPYTVWAFGTDFWEGEGGYFMDVKPWDQWPFDVSLVGPMHEPSDENVTVGCHFNRVRSIAAGPIVGGRRTKWIVRVNMVAWQFGGRYPIVRPHTDLQWSNGKWACFQSGLNPPAKKALEDLALMANAVAYTQDLEWSASFMMPAGFRVRVPTTPTGAKALFRNREAPLTPSGRRAALVHWVREHSRRTRDGSTTSVLPSLSGRVRLSWCGWDVVVTPSEFDLRRLEAARLRKHGKRYTDSVVRLRSVHELRSAQELGKLASMSEELYGPGQL